MYSCRYLVEELLFVLGFHSFLHDVFSCCRGNNRQWAMKQIPVCDSPTTEKISVLVKC